MCKRNVSANVSKYTKITMKNEMVKDIGKSGK